MAGFNIAYTDGYVLEKFEFDNEEEYARWKQETGQIVQGSNQMAQSNDINMANNWLQQVKLYAERWGFNRVPVNVKKATATTEDILAMDGVFVSPIFRDSIPKLVNARCELLSSRKTSNWRHVYKAKSGDTQQGEGVPSKQFVANRRNKIRYIAITYTQMDGTHFITTSETFQNGFLWKQFIENVWEGLAHAATLDAISKNNKYREMLDFIMEIRATWTDGALPHNVRAVVHELQDYFGEARTAFPPIPVSGPYYEE